MYRLNTFTFTFICDCTSSSLQVVMADLEVLSVISASEAGLPMSSGITSPDKTANATSSVKELNEYFYKFLLNLVAKFRVDGKLLEEKGCFIIR
jgi:hypothetical protein